MPKKLGYARVSTEDQDPAPQCGALKADGCLRVYKEKVSGARRDRPVLFRVLRALRPGDILVVWKLDRLGRSLRHLIDILEDLEGRGIGFRSISDNIDTTTPVGRLVFHIVGAMAEFERTLISERTRIGMQAARAQGKHIGRPPRLRTRFTAVANIDPTISEHMMSGMRLGKRTVQRAVVR